MSRKTAWQDFNSVHSSCSRRGFLEISGPQIFPSPIDALFERVAYRWWQRLGRNRLRVMEAAA